MARKNGNKQRPTRQARQAANRARQGSGKAGGQYTQKRRKQAAQQNLLQVNARRVARGDRPLPA